ncbi:hypothetical protein J132_09856 [Termitomyces sp. J132]|nr:hypothetical protein J132_09856 [Termitomyces sp. J132]
MSPSTPSITPSSAETFISSSNTLMSPLLPSHSIMSISDTTILPTSPSITNPISSSPESSDTIPNSSVHSLSALSSVTFIVSASSTLPVPSTSTLLPFSNTPASSSSSKVDNPIQQDPTPEPSRTSCLSPIFSTKIPAVLSTKTISTTLTSHRNGAISTSTSLEPGVLSTDNPKGPNGFARDTGAIVGVAVAGTCVIIIAVIVLFFLCKRRRQGTRYRSGGFGSSAGLQFIPWQPPLAGDDDALFYTQDVRRHSNGSFQRLGSVTHTSEMAHSGAEFVGAEHNGNSSESGFSHAQNQPPLAGADLIYVNAHHSVMPPPSAWYESVHGPLGADARSSLPSLYAGTSSNGHLNASTSSCHGHFYTPTSSHGHSSGDMYVKALSYGHVPPPPSSEHGLLQLTDSTTPPRVNPSLKNLVDHIPTSSHGHMYADSSCGDTYGHIPSEHGLIDPTSPPRANNHNLSLKNLVDRLRPTRGSLPTIVVANNNNNNNNKMTYKSSSSYSLPLQKLYPPQPQPQPQPPASFLRGTTVTLDRPNKPTLRPIETHGYGLWPPATLPPLPSPTNTENSRVLEDLLTPQLRPRLASSQYSSSASLRDHVDYSRPINGYTERGSEHEDLFN